MAHSHGLVGDDDRSAVQEALALARRPALVAPVVVAALATVIGLVWLWPTGSAPAVDGRQFFGERVKATVDAAQTVSCPFSSTPGEFLCDQISFTVTSGTPRGMRDSIQLPLGAGGPRLHDGDKVVMLYQFDAPAGAKYQFGDFQRSAPLAVLAVLFALAVLALGQLRGFLALVGVAVSFAVLQMFTLPALLEGRSPLAVALVSAAAVALVALYLAHGLSERTTVAVLGTLASLALTGAAASIFVSAAKLTGLGGEEVGFLQVFGGELNFQGLLLAGMVIGALGVLDDVTVTQVAAVWEVHRADPSLGAAALYQSGLRVGRDHIASTVNTLVLAYAGASLPLLLLFSTAGQSLGAVITGEAIAAEIVRTLVGSLGLVASVPITTALAALVVTRRPEDRHRESIARSGRPRFARRASRLGTDRPSSARSRLAATEYENDDE